MRIVKEGPLSIIIRGRPVPEWFEDEQGQRHEFDSMAILDEEGGFLLSSLAPDQCIIAPGAIYQRKSAS